MFSGDGGPATAAKIGQISGITADVNGNVYIVDAGNARIRMINPAGIISTIAGNGANGFTADGAPASGAALSHSLGDIAVDTDGDLYIVDGASEIDAAGITTTTAGNGTIGSAGDGGLTTNASISPTSDVAVNAAGTVYVGDDDHRIRAVTSPATTSRR